MAEYPLTRGDTLEIFLNVTAPGPYPTSPRVPVDIRGCEIWMTAKRSKNDADADAVFQVSTFSGDITITDGLFGKARILVPPASTVGLTKDGERFFYDIQIKSTSGVVKTIEKGILITDLDVTRAIA